MMLETKQIRVAELVLRETAAAVRTLLQNQAAEPASQTSETSSSGKKKT